MAVIQEVSSFEDFSVEIVDAFPDLCVYLTKSEFEAKGKEEIWCFTNSFPEKKIKFVTSFPDLKIQYVNSSFSAGWKNSSHKLKGSIC